MSILIDVATLHPATANQDTRQDLEASSRTSVLCSSWPSALDRRLQDSCE